MAGRELSERQREFCRLVAKGQSGRAAYAAAFGCSVGSAASAASRLLRRDYIQAELNRLSAAARELSRARDCQAIGDKAERMEMLWRMARDCEQSGNVGDAVRALAELNKMDGAYEPERVQVASVSCSFEALMEGMVGGRKT